MPVVDLDDLMEDEHLQAVGMFETHHHPSEGDTLLVRSPVNYSKSPSSIRRHAPRFGEHGVEIACQLGYSASDIEALQATGVLITDNGGV